jgi:hypothetical protein
MLLRFDRSHKQRILSGELREDTAEAVATEVNAV